MRRLSSPSQRVTFPPLSNPELFTSPCCNTDARQTPWERLGPHLTGFRSSLSAGDTPHLRHTSLHLDLCDVTLLPTAVPTCWPGLPTSSQPSLYTGTFFLDSAAGPRSGTCTPPEQTVNAQGFAPPRVSQHSREPEETSRHT